MDNIYMKCKCKNTIPIQRVNLGYKNCVNCSTVKQYGCAPITFHKTGNSIQIMSSEDAAKVAKFTRRKGYGTMLGTIALLITLSSSCKQPVHYQSNTMSKQDSIQMEFESYPYPSHDEWTNMSAQEKKVWEENYDKY